MLFRFKGDYTGKRTSITLFGVTFEGREPADVTDADGIRRLSNHPEFEVVSEFTADVGAFARNVMAEHRVTQLAVEAPKKRGRPRKGS